MSDDEVHVFPGGPGMSPRGDYVTLAIDNEDYASAYLTPDEAIAVAVQLIRVAGEVHP